MIAPLKQAAAICRRGRAQHGRREIGQIIGCPQCAAPITQRSGTAQGYASFKHLGGGGCEWGFYLAPDCPRGQGHGGTLGQLALQYAFCRLNMHEVHGQVLPHNAASLALHRRLGFRPADKAAGQEAQRVLLFVLRAENFLY